MKAWQIAKKIVDDAQAKIIIEKENDWTMSDMQSHDVMKIRTIWQSVAPGSGAPSSLVTGAVQSVENLGFDVSDAEKLLPIGFKARENNDTVLLMKTTKELFTLLNNAKKNEESDYWKYTEYKNFEDFLDASSFPEKTELNLNDKELFDLMYLGWMGQIAAGAFGTAIEGYSRESIKEAFGVVTDYLKKPNTYNDDITYELAFLMAVLEKGKDTTSSDIASEWVARVPFGWSAEDIALKNLLLGINPPQSGYLNNPYKEWIGAQMRGAVCGMVAPGDAKYAAKLAWIDGEISHYNSGIIGEVFNAVLTSLSFVEKDAKVLVEKTIDMLPKDSQYYSVVKYALDVCKESKTYEEALIKCEEQFVEYNLVHAFPNAAIQVVALYFGNGDFDKTMEIGAMAGLDVDCNTAQLGSIVAILSGKVGSKWSDPIGETLLTYVRGMEKLTVSELTIMTIDAMDKLK